MKIKVKVAMMSGCEELLPVKSHADDAAFDLRSRSDILVPVNKSTLVPTGVFIELPVNYEAQVRPRSGLALKHNITLTNSPGTIDAGYRGEVGVIMFNHGPEEFAVKRGDRIAQMVIAELPAVELETVAVLSNSDRGEGGFGSTGRK
ncbi:MAG: dUTP diphosphatase [Lentisphaerae bacterium]|nr:dUTP diphosphatase [Lentisphaerota bacterium]